MDNAPSIKAMTRREISAFLGMEEHTFTRKLKTKGILLPKGLVSPQSQKTIFNAFWYPTGYSKHAYEAYY